MRRCWIIFSALSIRLRPAPAFCHTFIDMMTRAPRMSFSLASYIMWLIHRYMTLGRRKPPHGSGWIRLSWPPDCNLQSRPRHQTDVRVRFASLDLVQDQRRWAYVQSTATALMYQNQNQPDAAGLVRLICRRPPRCQTLRRCKMSDLQKSSDGLSLNSTTQSQPQTVRARCDGNFSLSEPQSRLSDRVCWFLISATCQNLKHPNFNWNHQQNVKQPTDLMSCKTHLPVVLHKCLSLNRWLHS